ncbi:MAG: hypothetical protein WC205_10700 [Opitutaceae bacterium]
MKHSTFIAITALALLPLSAFAERYGSITTLTLQGTYYLTGSDVTQVMSNGDTRDTATHTAVEVSNRSILQTMSDRGLISGTSGYQIVMVAHAHMADGISWFAIKKKQSPVPVPADLLNLYVNDGPLNGQLVVDSNAVLKSLKQESHNAAILSVNNFATSGVLTQTWQSKAVKNGSVTEVVELVASTGTLTGVIDNPPDSGIGSVSFKLSGAKTVDLALYGMDSDTPPGTSSFSSTGATISLANIDFPDGSFVTLNSHLGSINFGSSQSGTVNFITNVLYGTYTELGTFTETTGGTIHIGSLSDTTSPTQ